jgi:hypothetical protein
MKPYHGGSAFPLQHHTRNYDINKREYIQDDGMTLRDYFAAQAMQAYLTVYINAGGRPPEDEDIAKFSYDTADAMLKARQVAR